MTYARVTDNPKMGWSDERKAKFSENCKKAHADGTWHKKSKKAVSAAISNGLKEGVKYRNRSNGQKLRHIKKRIGSENLVDKHTLPKVDDQVNIERLRKEINLTDDHKKGITIQESQDKKDFEKMREAVNMLPQLENPLGMTTMSTATGVSKKHMDFIIELFNKIEDIFGVRPDIDEFIGSAIEDKLQSIKDKLRKE